jgi:hypothetical protein
MDKKVVTVNVNGKLDQATVDQVKKSLDEEMNAIVEGENLDPISSDQESCANGLNINKNV